MKLRLVLLAVLSSVPPARAEPCTRPAMNLLRANDDVAFLEDPACRTQRWDDLKFIPLADGTYLSLGGELRERYESFRNSNWGRDPSDETGHLLQRLLVHADLHAGTHLRLFVQLASSLVHGRDGGPRASDKNSLDAQQVFTEVRGGGLALRVGRQEVQYGSARLVSVNDGPNTRRSFDGARLVYRLRDWQLDAFVLDPVAVKPDVLDDERIDGAHFWGAYAAGPVYRSMLGLDLYYLGITRDDAAFDQGTADERRHSVGLRAWGKPGPADYDVELVYQWGVFGAGSIRAWTVAASSGVTTGPARFGLKADITSGDEDPEDADLQTFHPLFPRGSYFGLAALIGPMNHVDLHPSLDLALAPTLMLNFDVDVFWRESAHDGVYRANGALQVTGQMTTENYVGTQASTGFDWKVTHYATISAVFSHMFAGAFLERSGVGRDIDYLAAWLTYRI